MRLKSMINNSMFLIATVIAMFAIAATNLNGHCDTWDGPVIKDGQKALKSGQINTVMKWIHKEQEEELKGVFDEALAVRKKGGKSREMADKYFLETLVRLHRESEGAPYTGLKPAGSTEKVVEFADKTIENGTSTDLIEKMTAKMREGIEKRYQKLKELEEKKSRSVEDGRRYVEAYVEYVHYVKKIHDMIAGGHAH